MATKLKNKPGKSDSYLEAVQKAAMQVAIKTIPAAVKWVSNEALESINTKGNENTGPVTQINPEIKIEPNVPTFGKEGEEYSGGGADQLSNNGFSSEINIKDGIITPDGESTECFKQVKGKAVEIVNESIKNAEVNNPKSELEIKAEKAVEVNPADQKSLDMSRGQ